MTKEHGRCIPVRPNTFEVMVAAAGRASEGSEQEGTQEQRSLEANDDNIEEQNAR